MYVWKQKVSYDRDIFCFKSLKVQPIDIYVNLIMKLLRAFENYPLLIPSIVVSSIFKSCLFQRRNTNFCRLLPYSIEFLLMKRCSEPWNSATTSQQDIKRYRCKVTHNMILFASFIRSIEWKTTRSLKIDVTQQRSFVVWRVAVIAYTTVPHHRI